MESKDYETVGFVGLGGMGRGLVKNLLVNGFTVTAFDIDDAPLPRPLGLGERGLRVIEGGRP